MAEGDEAVQVNVTPLIDIIFCLCIFFICSFHFKSLEGKLDSWLPKSGSVPGAAAPPVTLEEVRLVLRRAEGATTLAFGARPLGTLTGQKEQDAPVIAALDGLLATQKGELARAGKDAPVVVDGEPSVPWRDVVSVVDASRRAGLERVEFAHTLDMARPQ